MEYVRATRVSLKGHLNYNERWLQRQISADPSILGLGDVDVKDTERRQPRAGRLDLLLYDSENNTRYEVEIQLGATDESHIIRTLEYWDNERRRFPQYEHIAVIAAEEITGRFLNVINLFNQSIPLIAIQMSALEVAGNLTLHATRVLDLALPAPEEEDEPGQDADYDYWLRKSSPDIMKAVGRAVDLVNTYGLRMQPKYNKYYIGLQRDGLPDNFVELKAQRNKIRMDFRIPRTDELDARIDEWGLNLLRYDKHYKRYCISLTPDDLDTHREELLELTRLARGLPELETEDPPVEDTPTP